MRVIHIWQQLRHTSYVIRHTSHATRHTPHVSTAGPLTMLRSSKNDDGTGLGPVAIEGEGEAVTSD